MNYAEVSYRLLHEFAKKHSYLIRGIKNDLVQAEMPYSLEEYFATIVMTMIISTPLLPVLIIFFWWLLLDLSLAIIGSIIFFGLIITAELVVFYIMPSQVASGRKKKIENALHFATIYLSTLAGAGTPPHLLFKVLGTFSEFSEISDIASKISRDIEIFGLNPAEAIARSVERVPSSNLRELLWGIRGTITSGGDLRRFLEEKAEAYTNEFKRKLEEFVKVLSIFMEIYITVVIVGSVLALILTTIMGVVGGGVAGLQELQLIIVVIGLPMISIMFIMLIRSSSPTEV